MLLGISYFTSRGADNQTFFNADKKSPWFLVAFGMIGASLSGVTFISIPGAVGAGGTNTAFSYMQMVYGYMVGYAIIALVLMPIYYRMGLTTIYTYLNDRFGKFSYFVGSLYFLLSRVVGASLRLFLVAIVFQKIVMDSFGIPFFLTVMIAIVLIWVYTFQGGIKTIVITDTLQTVCMLAAVFLTIYAIGNALGSTGIIDTFSMVKESAYSQMFFFEDGWNDPNNFFKQFLSGALIATAMTGLDQDMMQKNLTCKDLPSAQKNVLSFSIVLIFANLLFLALGALLYMFAANQGIEIPSRTDQLYPLIALNHLSPYIGILFVLGLIAAAYSSADSALTSLTTSFYIDILKYDQRGHSEKQQKRTRMMVHVGFSLLIFFIILIVNALNDDAIINKLFKAAGYTYGPILGLFTFGIVSKRKIMDQWTIPVCLIAPLLTFIIDYYSADLFGGFKFGNTILGLNALFTIIGLLIISKKNE
ncbi:sodium:solute symporter [Portibacter lacus]|uniref:Sodium:solute symporter n=1 Tax=Portibacter lacus TaxID=1099794 RepID=A0AA37SND9_9BACT|nr:sodium:solute symporter [Portibacter lacus]